MEQYIVEPLLRLALDGHPGAAWKKSFKVGSKVADYVVTRKAYLVRHLGVRHPAGPWLETRDFQQVRAYANALDCRSVLIDANRVYLIEHRA